MTYILRIFCFVLVFFLIKSFRFRCISHRPCAPFTTTFCVSDRGNTGDIVVIRLHICASVVVKHTIISVRMSQKRLGCQPVATNKMADHLQSPGLVIVRTMSDVLLVKQSPARANN